MTKKTVLFIIVAMICFVAFNHKILFRNTDYIKNIKTIGKSNVTLSITDTKQLQSLSIDAIGKVDKIASKKGSKYKLYKFLSNLYN